jgi:hypothetical protein
MKRSKIFLGITTGVLAVVAFTAAKTAKFGTIKHGYYTNGSGKCSVNGNAGSFFTIQFNGTANRAKTSEGSKLLFASHPAGGGCVVPLYTNAND